MESWQGGEIKAKGREIKVNGGENRLRRGKQAEVEEREKSQRLGISYKVFCTRNMKYTTGKLRDTYMIDDTAVMRTGSEQCISHRFVVNEQGKMLTFQEKMEVTNRRVSS